MTTRNLTEVFILMRNNAVRSRQIYAEENRTSSEHMQLVSLNDSEQGEVSNSEILLPPFWTNQLEDAHRIIEDIQNKVNELKTLHRRHLERSTFDESTEYEHLIEKCTATISMSINNVHKIVQSIKAHSFDGSFQERRLTQNVVLSIAGRLQEVSGSFRATQSQYLHQLKCMEERSNVYFDNKVDSKYEDSIISMDAMQSEQDDIDAYFMNYSNGKVMSEIQLLYMEEENVKVSQQREEEINVYGHEYYLEFTIITNTASIEKPRLVWYYMHFKCNKLGSLCCKFYSTTKTRNLSNNGLVTVATILVQRRCTVAAISKTSVKSFMLKGAFANHSSMQVNSY